MRTVIAVALFLAAIAFAAMDLASAPPDLVSVQFELAWGTFALTGAVLAVRRPANPIGWLFLVIAVAANGSNVAGSGDPGIRPAARRPSCGSSRWRPGSSPTGCCRCC